MERIRTKQIIKEKILKYVRIIWCRQKKLQRSKDVVFTVNGTKWYYPDCDLITLDEATTYENDVWRLPSIEEFTEMDNKLSYDGWNNILTLQADNILISFASYPFHYVDGMSEIAQKRTKDTYERTPFWTNWRDNSGVFGAHCCFLLRCNGFRAYHGAHPIYNKAGVLLIENKEQNERIQH